MLIDLDKACEWLANQYDYADEEYLDDKIQEFRKAMGAEIKENLTTEVTWQDIAKIADIIGHTNRLDKEGQVRSSEEFYKEILKKYKEK